MSKNNQNQGDHLALGLTRSPMFMGVNIRFFFANLVICTLICVNVHTFWGVPLFLVIHLIALNLSIKEPNFFHLRTKSFLLTPPMLNRRYWGGVDSYEPW